jgi:uncharacterized protein YndB with AHSA1/START domain
MTPEPAPMAAAITRTLQINVPIEKAFQVFTQGMAMWWPPTHHIAKQPFTEIVVEPRIGGRWFERDAEGAECDWGRVLVWEPPKRLIVSWNLQSDWKFDPDLGRASEVALEFISEGPEKTRLEFEHRRIERHGADYERVRAGVDSPGGWTMVLAQYATAIAASK